MCSATLVVAETFAVAWRRAADVPAGEEDRRITGAWIRGSDSVGLLVTPVKGDPEPRPVG